MPHGTKLTLNHLASRKDRNIFFCGVLVCLLKELDLPACQTELNLTSVWQDSYLPGNMSLTRPDNGRIFVCLAAS